MSESTNLQPLKPSRRKPEPGDLFALKMLDRFLFGRVVLADLPRERAPMPGAYLIYIYDQTATSQTAPSPESLAPSRLLIPPAFINRMPWTKGYFERVDHAALGPAARLARHCFRDTRGRYLDEEGRILDGPIEPCGDWGLYSYSYLDDVLSDALGIPRVSG